MKFFLNTLSLENPKSDITDEDIQNTIQNLISLIKQLSQYDSDIIFPSSFISYSLNNKTIYNHLIDNFDEDDVKLILVKVGNQCDDNVCSDINEDYLNDDIEIDFMNCKEKVTNMDIFGTFLACSLFSDSPIITPDKLNQLNHFDFDEIHIEENMNTHKIVNYKLSDYMNIINNFQTNIYERLDTWEEYLENTKESLEYIDFTKSCIKDFKKNANINDKYIQLTRTQIERLNTIVKNNGGNHNKCENITNSGVNARPESSSRFNHFKNNILYKKNCNNIKESMTWHSRIDYYRLYFTCGLSENICFTFFTKKIPNP